MTHRYVPESKEYPDCGGVCVQCGLEWDDPKCPMSKTIVQEPKP